MRLLLAILVESPHFKRLLGALGVFVAILVAGTLGYLVLGKPGTTVIDGLYMTFITVATIGYEEVVDMDHSDLGRIFTMAIALAGIANMTFLFSTVTAFLLETNLNHAYRRRRMQAAIDTLSGHFIVCGAGRIGGYVIDELRADRRSFVVVETDAATLERRLEADPRLGGHRIASLMIRPQMVSLVDELLRAGERLAVEEVVVPARPSPLRIGALGHSVEWLLVAVRDGSEWRFNPPQDASVSPGQALVVIASAEGRRELLARVAG
ncbi:MAG: ion channel [Burkholderiales bacterium]